jgi:hypothetical protein
MENYTGSEVGSMFELSVLKAERQPLRWRFLFLYKRIKLFMILLKVLQLPKGRDFYHKT